MDAYEYLMSQLKQQDSEWKFVNTWPLAQVLNMCRFAEEFHDCHGQSYWTKANETGAAMSDTRAEPKEQSDES